METAEEQKGAEEPPVRERQATWTPLDTAAITLTTLIGGVVRYVGVSFPREIIFDETYYAKDACWYAKVSASICGIDAEQTGVHPPLGKWLIALGIRVFGYDSLGWRIAAVVAGTITIALLYLLARRLLGSTLGATFASGLLALDFLHVVQSRIAMLDIFVPLFGVAAVLFAVYDRERLADGKIGEGGPLDRPWRLAAGAAAGASFATKYSGVFFVVLVLALTVVWEVSARRRSESEGGGPLRRTLLEEGASIVAWLMLVPLAVLAITYVGRIEGPVLALPWSEGSWWEALVRKQTDALNFHLGLEASHSYQSSPWSWILLKRAVAYYYDGDVGAGRVREIFATGSPFVWWSSILALGYTAYSWIRRRDFLGPEGVIIAGFAWTYLPWVVLSRGRPAVFLFYLLPTVPFMCLALGLVAVRIGRSWEAKAAIALYAAATVGLFAFYYPLLVGTAIKQDAWRARIWAFDNCDKPQGSLTVSTFTTTVEGSPVTSTTETTEDTSSLPPVGWCWI